MQWNGTIWKDEVNQIKKKKRELCTNWCFAETAAVHVGFNNLLQKNNKQFFYQGYYFKYKSHFLICQRFGKTPENISTNKAETFPSSFFSLITKHCLVSLLKHGIFERHQARAELFSSRPGGS